MNEWVKHKYQPTMKVGQNSKTLLTTKKKVLYECNQLIRNPYNKYVIK